MMRILLFLALSALAAVSFVSAWECDSRCPDYEECLAEKTRRDMRRVLDKTLLEDTALLREPSPMVGAKKLPRGRHLKASETFSYFLLKMYHEESVEYCWQAEWKDRGWCLECEESQGSDSHSCDQGDQLWIQYCNTEVDEQYFVYEPVASGGGRIKPYTRQDLCLEKDSEESMTLTLQPCDDTNTLQILIGFDMYSQFELHPYDDTSRCLTQPHHPKKEEEIQAYTCETARNDKTSLWQVYEAVVEYTTHDSPAESPIYSPSMYETNDEPTTDHPTFAPSDSTSDIQLKDIGDCTPTNPCGPCTGDCDTYADCEGTLECYHRAYNEAVPSCSGGESLDNRKYNVFRPFFGSEQVFNACPFAGRDFCIPPEYINRPHVQDRGWNGCSASSPCAHCFGDCDEDDECAGNLVCYKRGPGEAVPSCRGGEDIDDGKYTNLSILLQLFSITKHVTLVPFLLQELTFACHPSTTVSKSRLLEEVLLHWF